MKNFHRSTKSERSDTEARESRGMAGDGKRRGQKVSIEISSDEEEGKDFAPQDLRSMGVISVGAIGLDCLASIESMRSKSKNLQGGVSGKMRRDLDRAKEVINTLIFKSEAAGDPSFLKMKNKELTAQIRKLEMEEVRKDKKIGELTGMLVDLKKEIMDLTDRLDEVEEDRRKARSHIRFTRSMMRKKGIEITGEGDQEE